MEVSVELEERFASYSQIPRNYPSYPDAYYLIKRVYLIIMPRTVIPLYESIDRVQGVVVEPLEVVSANEVEVAQKVGCSPIVTKFVLIMGVLASIATVLALVLPYSGVSAKSSSIELESPPGRILASSEADNLQKQIDSLQKQCDTMLQNSKLLEKRLLDLEDDNKVLASNLAVMTQNYLKLVGTKEDLKPLLFGPDDNFCLLASRGQCPIGFSLTKFYSFGIIVSKDGSLPPGFERGAQHNPGWDWVHSSMCCLKV